MRKLIGLLGLVCGFFWLSSAQATVRIDIDLTTQTMKVEGATESYDWPVSSARSGYVTPHGSFKPYSLQRMHYSRKYHMSPMPYSIFFAGGYAIHGTYSVSQLGRPASHGCIRLAPGNAAKLYQMVKAEGASITIAGTPPGGHMMAKANGAKYAAAHHKKAMHELAYAPYHQASPSVGSWQANPTRWW
jgi:L,D-transpeptidase catalytic domain